MKLPISDLHCDLLFYLARVEGSTINDLEDIGVTLPYLKEGHVKHQIMAVFTPTGPGSVETAELELEKYRELLEHDEFYNVYSKSQVAEISNSEQIAVTLALESASTLASEDEPLRNAFKRLDKIIEEFKHIFYISFTHHTENRFGGGNYSNNVGLKEDGKSLLEYMDGKGIAADLSHASDNLAYGIFNHIEAKNLDVPVIASHSNFRELTDHVRNLPPDLIDKVLAAEGLIGMNFLRLYLHDSDPNMLGEHIRFGLNNKKIAPYLAFGADFFHRKGHPDPTRHPLFFKEHEDAGKYPTILQGLAEDGISKDQLEALSYRNVCAYMERKWKS